jgi:predicted Zn-dependent protease
MMGVYGVYAADIKVVNCAAVSPTMMKQAVDFAEAQLQFQLKEVAGENADCPDTESCITYVLKRKGASDAAVIGVVSTTNFALHQVLDTNRMAAVINVEYLKSDDEKTAVWRLQRMLLRSVAFLLGIPPAPDPRCVTRNYRSLEDLDSMGRNFTPPYNDLIRRRAYDLNVYEPPQDVQGRVPQQPSDLQSETQNSTE